MPPPTSLPRPLPPGLLFERAAGRHLLICLDYDGTLSQITPALNQAYPVAGAREVIERRVAGPRWCQIAIVSGRDIDVVRTLLGVSSGLYFAGSHGLELMGPDGRSRLAPNLAHAIPALAELRSWLADHVPAGRGFVIEQKKWSVALHYRLAPAPLAEALCTDLRAKIASLSPPLRLSEGKMVLEALPAGADKGQAVRALLAQVPDQPLPIYCGDDLTDEAPFELLREQGITVLVGSPQRPSWAQYRVADPEELVSRLRELAQALDT